MSGRFDYVRYDEAAAVNQQKAKELMLGVEAFITTGTVAS